jgi:hypothetical protein
VSSPVIRALAQSHLNETAKHEADLAAKVHRVIGPNPVTDGASVPAVYEEFCRKFQVPSLPSRPTTAAAFCLAHCGLDVEELLEVMAGVSRAHLAANFACPVGDWCVNAVLGRRLKVEAPRSWTKEDRAEFLRLPLTVQKIVLRRELDRDRGVHQAMQKISDERKQLQAAIENVRQTNETNPETQTTKKDNHSAENQTVCAGA